MGERGRKSTASLTVIPGSLDRRPSPPEELSADEAVVWERTVAGEAADVFGTPALQQMLLDYCRHVISAEKLGVVIARHLDAPPNAEDSISMRDLDRLMKMRDRETRAISDKATKLRLTNQSRYTPGAAGTAAKNAAGEKKPWHSVG